MPSTFAWLDQSEEQRRKVLDIVDMFKEQGTVDELGLGTVRDAVADILFPGTSNLMTRAAYYLFVPWMYQRLERQRTPSSEIAAKARKEELKLIERLITNGELQGVIGRIARSNLRRIPSSLYWAGMKRLGICSVDESQDNYHRSVDRLYERRKAALRSDDGDTVDGAWQTWNLKIPTPPADWPAGAVLKLNREQAEFLRDQVSLSAPTSLFALLTRLDTAPKDVEYPWAHPHRDSFTPKIIWQLDHAQNISEVTHGAALLYNLILAELTSNQDLIEEYRSNLTDWATMLDGRMSVLREWNRNDAWICVESEGARAPRATHDFIESWCEIAINDDAKRVSESKQARALVINRERRLKGPLARVENKRALELWQGASSANRLQYRWSNASVIVQDIVHAIHGAPNA